MVDVQGKLDEIVEMVERAKAKPLTGACVLPRAELLASLEQLRDLLPREMTTARQVLRDKDKVLAEARSEAERLLDKARQDADSQLANAHQERSRILDEAAQERKRLISESEVMAEAARQADELLERAEREAARMQYETQDYVERTLGRFEELLATTLDAVSRGRAKVLAELNEAETIEAADGSGGQSGQVVVPEAAEGALSRVS